MDCLLKGRTSLYRIKEEIYSERRLLKGKGRLRGADQECVKNTRLNSIILSIIEIRVFNDRSSKGRRGGFKKRLREKKAVMTMSEGVSRGYILLMLYTSGNAFLGKRRYFS